MAEAMLSLGNTLGPPLGSILYASFGYRNTFYAFAAATAVILVLCAFTMPNSLNHAKELNKEQSKGVEEEKELMEGCN
jgi:predicted MFS family arabinose efflux permease